MPRGPCRRVRAATAGSAEQPARAQGSHQDDRRVVHSREGQAPARASQREALRSSRPQTLKTQLFPPNRRRKEDDAAAVAERLVQRLFCRFHLWRDFNFDHVLQQGGAVGVLVQLQQHADAGTDADCDRLPLGAQARKAHSLCRLQHGHSQGRGAACAVVQRNGDHGAVVAGVRERADLQHAAADDDADRDCRRVCELQEACAAGRGSFRRADGRRRLCRGVWRPDVQLCRVLAHDPELPCHGRVSRLDQADKAEDGLRRVRDDVLQQHRKHSDRARHRAAVRGEGRRPLRAPPQLWLHPLLPHVLGPRVPPQLVHLPLLDRQQPAHHQRHRPDQSHRLHHHRPLHLWRRHHHRPPHRRPSRQHRRQPVLRLHQIQTADGQQEACPPSHRPGRRHRPRRRFLGQMILAACWDTERDLSSKKSYFGCGLAKKAPRKGPSESSELLQGLREQAKLRAAGPKQHLAAHRRCVELCLRTGLAKDQCFPACKWVFFVPDPAALLADAHAPEEDAAVMRIVRWCRAHGNDAKKAAELFFRDPFFRPKRPADTDADAAAEMRPEADAEADAAAAAAMSAEEGEKSAAETTETTTATDEEEGEAQQQQQTKGFKRKSAFEEFRRKRGKPIRDEL